MIDCCFKGCCNGLKFEKNCQYSKNFSPVSGTQGILDSPASGTPGIPESSASWTPGIPDSPVSQLKVSWLDCIPIRYKIVLVWHLCMPYISYRKQAWRSETMASIVLTLKICLKSAGFTVNTISAKIFLASRLFNKKCLCRQLIWPNFCIPLMLKIFLPYGYFFKKVHNILLYDAGQFYVKNKMAAE